MRYTVFDIETRIDKSLVQAVYFPQAKEEGLSDDAVYRRMQQRLREEQGNDFFPLSFHLPISIAVGQVNEERTLTGVETIQAADTAQSGTPEEALVRAFWNGRNASQALWSVLMGGISTCPCWSCKRSSMLPHSTLLSWQGPLPIL